MLHGLPARGFDCRRQRASGVTVELPRLVLKRVGIHRIKAQAKRGRLLAQYCVVIDLVPRKMQRHARRHRAKPMNYTTVLEFLVNVGWFTRKREPCKTSAPAPQTPAGNSNREARDASFDGVDVHPAPRELTAEAVIFVAQRLLKRSVVLGNVHRVNACALPASTLIMFPVDLADISDAKK